MAPRILNERSEVRTSRIVAVAGGTLIILIAVAFGFQVVFKTRINQTYTVQKAFPLPGVVPNETELRLALEAKQRAALEGAGGRMPIDQAIDAIVARGADAYDPLEAAP